MLLGKGVNNLFEVREQHHLNRGENRNQNEEHNDDSFAFKKPAKIASWEIKLAQYCDDIDEHDFKNNSADDDHDPEKDSVALVGICELLLGMRGFVVQHQQISDRSVSREEGENEVINRICVYRR